MTATHRNAPYPTAADDSRSGWPLGIPYIIGNELCERFSFYGMKAILKVYVLSLYTLQGMSDTQARSGSTAVVHFFNAAVYATPIFGAVLADRWLGRYRTVLSLSLFYCAGHAVLSLTEGSLSGTYLGLALIALGAGGIKPNVSAMVGDQFGRANQHRRQKAYDAFYFAINFGSFFATLLIPWTKQAFGWSAAFAIPGVLMAVATWVFWLGRRSFVHAPPSGGGQWAALSAAERRSMWRIAEIFLLISVFWALWDQYASSWVDQGSMMRTGLTLPWVGAVTVLPEQLQALNPVLVMLLIPLMSWGVYPLVERAGVAMTPLRRIGVGMFVTGLAFVATALLQQRLDGGESLHIAWQFFPYALLTIAEIMVSITGLEFAYSQAPERMKSMIMSLFLLSTTVGNLLTGLLAKFGNLGLANFFWTFASLITLAGIIFAWRARSYRYRAATDAPAAV